MHEIEKTLVEYGPEGCMEILLSVMKTNNDEKSPFIILVFPYKGLIHGISLEKSGTIYKILKSQFRATGDDIS